MILAKFILNVYVEVYLTNVCDKVYAGINMRKCVIPNIRKGLWSSLQEKWVSINPDSTIFCIFNALITENKYH